MPDFTQRYLDWPTALRTLRTADILLCRKSNLMGKAIEHVTHSQYVHAAMVGWTYSYENRYARLMMGETISHHDARVIDLESEIARWPGYYDAFRVRKYNWRHDDGPDMAWHFMREASGGCYGWNYIWRVYFRRRLGRWLIPPIQNSDNPWDQADCSGLVHRAIRNASGPMWEKHDCDVTPGHLSERFTDYVGTLVYTQ